MIVDFIQDVDAKFHESGYFVESNPTLPGVRGLLKVISPRITSVVPSKFFNYYLFLDWDNDLFGRLDSLVAAQKSFRVEVNKDFTVPNGWRLTLPNIVVAAVSDAGFPSEAIKYVQSRYQIPFMGGEVGQMMLFDLQTHRQYCHYKKAYKQTGSIPIGYAVDELSNIFREIYPDAKVLTQ
jgi:hypothetical protein